MSRARATALALVNWKGVFFERYLLDRHVTALEGANGAGKTTVMIAAYVVLLPDMSKLRFTNLGETAATGGDRGIWGRLGELTRPSYSALELDLAGERLLAGVALTRKAEPSVELTPFLISALPKHVKLSDLLLLTQDEHESVPELPELKENVARLGAKIEFFASARDYFAALFDLGVGALRLATDEERGKLSDMLRTSMTGGISRAITSELRSFLLREQSGLGDTLGRMRANLDTCRRTRSEVSDARFLEQEISGVYEAGQAMFSAALLGCRAQSRTRRARVAVSERAVHEARANKLELDLAVADALGREQAKSSRLVILRTEREQAKELARTSAQWNEIKAQLSSRRSELSEKSARAAEAHTSERVATEQREAARAARDRAREAHERAALGLAHQQAGLDQLYQRAAAYRNASRLQAQVCALLQRSQVLADEAPVRIAELRNELDELDRERLMRQRTLELSARAGQEWDQAYAALISLVTAANPAESVAPESAFDRARIELERLQQQAALVSQRAELLEQLAESERLAARQNALRSGLQELGLPQVQGQSELALELTNLEQALLQAEERSRSADEQCRLTAHELALAHDAVKQVEAKAQSHARLTLLLQRLESATGPCVPTREALLRAQSSLLEERGSLREQISNLNETREKCLRDASDYEAAGGRFAPELLRLRDELDGVLLASRFEELEPKQAAELEAILGPLAQAIVVDDLDQATDKLRGKTGLLPELYLLRAGTEPPPLGLHKSYERAGEVIVTEGALRRIARIPDQPSLGRRAREARVTELRRNAVELGDRIAQAQARTRLLDSVLGDVQRLVNEADALEAGDQRGQLETCAERLLYTEKATNLAAAEQGQARAQVLSLRPRLKPLRALMSEGFLLEERDYSARAVELRAELALSERAEQELSQKSKAWNTLKENFHVLRTPPAPAADLARFASEREAIEAKRDQLARAIEALTDFAAHAEALAYEDADRNLASKATVLPALTEQHAASSLALQLAEQDFLANEAKCEAAVKARQEADGEASLAQAHCDRLLREEAELSVGAAATLTLELDEDERNLAILQLEREARELVSEHGKLVERARHAGQLLAEREAEAVLCLAAAGPAEERWHMLQKRAEAANVLRLGDHAQANRPENETDLWAEARSKRTLLLDRLASCRGGEAIARELPESERDDENSYLNVWLRVRDWLSRRVPSQVSQEEDPLLALERLRDHLAALEQRLLYQERDLRGASEDVARGIEVQMRRAKSQVRRLNQSLEGTSFGSIAGIRVELKRTPQMEPVLRALSEGSAQELLFQTNLPIEDALTEILRRWGAGRSGGSRILDYREYIELAVLVQRRADSSWEPANPTRLSTGEAIGVGAALMMVVLTEWERDANLLRTKRSLGSLRFLFLDEANRLSQDNLGVLFDLCKTLDLQLMIAAPEVARAEGNTTYRLVRRVTEDGREEVVVSGRRAPLAEEAAELPVVAENVAQLPVQPTLF